MKFFFIGNSLYLVLIICQVGYVGPNKSPAPQQRPCVIGQQPLPQRVPPIPVEQTQQHNVPQQSPQQPCNKLQQPPSNPRNPGKPFPSQQGAGHFRQPETMHSPAPSPHPPAPAGYPQPPTVHQEGAHPVGYYPPIPPGKPLSHPMYPEPQCPMIPPVNKRRLLVWCTCSTCKDVVPNLLQGNCSGSMYLRQEEYKNGEPKLKFCEREEYPEHPDLIIPENTPDCPCKVDRKVVMTYY